MTRRWPVFISINFFPSLSVSDHTTCHTEHSAASAASYYTSHFFISSKWWSLTLVDLSLCGTLSDARDQFLSESLLDWVCRIRWTQPFVYLFTVWHQPTPGFMVFASASSGAELSPWAAVVGTLGVSRSIWKAASHPADVFFKSITESFHRKKSVLRGFKAKQRESFDAVRLCKSIYGNEQLTNRMAWR